MGTKGERRKNKPGRGMEMGLHSLEMGLALFFCMVTDGLRADLPALLVTESGKRVQSVAEWEKTRRPEILKLFQSCVFGRRPVERPANLWFEQDGDAVGMISGRAIRKKVRIRYRGAGGEGLIRLTAFIPKSDRPAPAFVLICNRDPKKNIDPDRNEKSQFWPVEEIISRGYAALAFFNGDVGPDCYNGFTNGVHAVFQPNPAVRKPDSWGTLSGWAWGASRVMDWIETEPLLDKTHVAVIGHSRGGKTALWCGATDRRFALTISNDSGCGGAKLNRMDLPQSEQIGQITRSFPHWFCKNFSTYANHKDALPVDQHELIALMAPRLVYVASASQDKWAGPPGEFRSCQLASPVWELYGKKGLAGDAFPLPGTSLQEGCIGYHLREGKHDLLLYDWERYMDFADRHGFKKAARAGYAVRPPLAGTRTGSRSTP